MLFVTNMRMRKNSEQISCDVVEEYQRLIKLNPKDVALHFELGCLFKKLGKREEALQEWRIVIQIDPNNLAARRAIQELSG